MFASAQEASACLEYVKRKFTRCMLGTLKATQHNPKDTWANVPLQDFTENSDIIWDEDKFKKLKSEWALDAARKGIHFIDYQLYKKYNLNDEEIAFIETMIKSM